MAAAVITVNTRASMPGGSTTCAPPLRLEAGSVSCGQRMANAMPQAIETSPGTAKAARHPIHLMRKPVIRAANAMPRLPASPLMPITKPGLRACLTSMGMPTGW
jgi:hypothetical protein